MKTITKWAAVAVAALATLPAFAAEETVLATWTPSKAASQQETKFPGSFAQYGYYFKPGFGATEQNVPEKDFPSTLKAGDIIRIYYYPNMDVVTNSKPAQLQLVVKQNNSGWTWTQICEYVDMPNQTKQELSTFDYVIGSSQTTFKDYRDEAEADESAFVPDVASEIAYLQAHGFWIKGQCLYLNKVEVIQVGAAANPDEGWNELETYTVDPAFDLGSWGKILEIPASVFENAVIGDKIRISGVSEDGAQVQLAYKNASWTWTQFVGYDDVKEGQYNYVIKDEAILEGLKLHGLYVKGKLFVIDKVSVWSETRQGADKPADQWEESNVYSFDPFDLSNWGEILEIPASAFQTTTRAGHTLAVGDKIVLEGEAESGAQVQLAYKVVSDNYKWTPFVECENVTGGKYEHVIKDEVAVENILLDGLYVKGQLWKPSKMTLYTPKSDIETGVEAVDVAEDAPVVYYNMQGIRVKNPVAGQLLIRVQGKKATKVVVR